MSEQSGSSVSITLFIGPGIFFYKVTMVSPPEIDCQWMPF